MKIIRSFATASPFLVAPRRPTEAPSVSASAARADKDKRRRVALG
jgi:hypothetical protein